MSVQPLPAMEQPEKFSLHWSDFDANLRSSLASLRKGEDFCDLTLVTEDGQTLRVHRLLLSASSPLLDQMMKMQDHPKPIIFLRGTKINDLNSLIDFIYNGEVEVLGDQLDNFLALANDLKVKGLSKEVNITKNNVNTNKNMSSNRKNPKTINKHASLEEVDASKIKNYSEADPPTNIKEEFEFQDIVGLKLSTAADIENESKSLYNCNWCPNASISLKGLQKHKNRKHPNEKPELAALSAKSVNEMFPCNLCDKLSVSKGGLQKHMVRNHHEAQI